MIGSSNSVSEDELIAEIALIQSNVEGLYIPGAVIGEKLASTISTFENVRVLMLSTSKKNKTIAQMANLEELYFDRGICDENIDEMYDTKRTFIGEAAKLKKMYVRSYRISFKRFDFAELNRDRMKIQGACKLKIYIDSDRLFQFGKLDRRTFYRIEIVRTSTELSGNPHTHAKYAIVHHLPLHVTIIFLVIH